MINCFNKKKWYWYNIWEAENLDRQFDKVYDCQFKDGYITVKGSLAVVSCSPYFNYTTTYFVYSDVAFATNAFELFLDYGNQIKARSKAMQTFIVQLACGSDGYLPTEKAEKGSHYSAYVSSGVTGHKGGEILVRKTLDEINKMFEQKKCF